MSGLQRLQQTDESLVLEFVRANGLAITKLRCEYTRQQDEGRYISKFGRPMKIMYDLMLCRLCGNLEGSRNNTPYCPCKLRGLLGEIIKRLPAECD